MLLTPKLTVQPSIHTCPTSERRGYPTFFPHTHPALVLGQKIQKNTEINQRVMPKFYNRSSSSSSESQISGGTLVSSRIKLSGSIWLFVSSCDEPGLYPDGRRRASSSSSSSKRPSGRPMLLEECSGGRRIDDECCSGVED